MTSIPATLPENVRRFEVLLYSSLLASEVVIFRLSLVRPPPTSFATLNSGSVLVISAPLASLYLKPPRSFSVTRLLASFG